MNALPDSTMRVIAAAREAGLDIAVTEMPQSTRTAEEAAAACGCGVGQIVKSLIFRGKQSGKPLLLLVSGINRVDEIAVAGRLGETLERPDAAFVREITGFAIGGVPPLGHRTQIATYLDEDLLAYETVFAAAGTPRTIFSVQPTALQSVTGAKILKMLE